MHTLSWILSSGAIIFDIAASLTKGDRNMLKILALIMLSNLSIALSYVINFFINGDGLNGSFSCFLGAAICFINFFFNRKKKPIPLWLSGIYAIAFIAVNFVTEFTGATVIAIAACLTFVMSVIQDKGSMFRLWTLSNCLLWCVYDVAAGAYQSLFTHTVLTLFFIAGIIVHDRRPAAEKDANEEK